MGICFASLRHPQQWYENRRHSGEHKQTSNEGLFEKDDMEMFYRAKNRGFDRLDERSEGVWKNNFEFVLLGDAQLGFNDQKIEEEFTDLAVKFINDRFENKEIKFVVVCGDHTHNFEDVWNKKLTIEENRSKRKEQLKKYKEIWRQLNPKIPLVCVCGNHDVGNKPTKETIELYTDEFGDDYIAFWAGGVKFITVNSQLVQHPEESGSLAREQEDWFQKQLEGDCQKIVFCHIPPFCWHPDEKHTNFNWPQDRRKKWLDMMDAAGVKNVYCAHYHRQAQGKYKGLKVMVTGALGTSIFTKEAPEDIQQKGAIEVASFKVSREGFGGLGPEEDKSGLYVVNVGKEKVISEDWMSILRMRKIMDKSDSRQPIPPEQKHNALTQNNHSKSREIVEVN